MQSKETTELQAIDIELNSLKARMAELEARRLDICSKFKCDEIFPVVAYLVSLVEGKEYKYKEKQIPTEDLVSVMDSEKFRRMGNFGYRIGFICSDEDAAVQEVNLRIKDIENASKPLSMINDVLLQPAVNYVQIIFYKPVIGIKFVSNLGYDINAFGYKNNETKIVDVRYQYIIDFVNSLTTMCFEQNQKFTETEMRKYAEEYAMMYRMNNVNGDTRK